MSTEVEIITFRTDSFSLDIRRRKRNEIDNSIFESKKE
jgi:hypothetical protein